MDEHSIRKNWASAELVAPAYTSERVHRGSDRARAIAVTIIGGQSLCLFLTLLLVPVAYVKFDAIEQAVVGDAAKRWLGRISAANVGRLRPAPE